MKNIVLSVFLTSVVGAYDIHHLKKACKKGSLSEVTDLISNHKIDVNAETCSSTIFGYVADESALMIATKRGHIAIMQELIKAGAHVNHREGCDQPHMGTTVLTCAIQANSLKAVELLLEHGACVEDLADVPSCVNLPIPTRSFPHISYAIMVNADPIIIQRLINHAYNVNERDMYKRYTPYMVAYYYNNIYGMKALERAGADTTLYSI